MRRPVVSHDGLINLRSSQCVICTDDNRVVKRNPCSWQERRFTDASGDWMRPLNPCQGDTNFACCGTSWQDMHLMERRLTSFIGDDAHLNFLAPKIGRVFRRSGRGQWSTRYAREFPVWCLWQWQQTRLLRHFPAIQAPAATDRQTMPRQ